MEKLRKSVVTPYNTRVAVFMGTLMAMYNTGGQFLQKRRSGRRLSKALRVLVGLLSGASVAILPPGMRRFLVYLLFTRSAEVDARTRRAHSGKTDIFSSHESVGLTMASMAVITTAWFGWPELATKDTCISSTIYQTSTNRSLGTSVYFCETKSHRTDGIMYRSLNQGSLAEPSIPS